MLIGSYHTNKKIKKVSKLKFRLVLQDLEEMYRKVGKGNCTVWNESKQKILKRSEALNDLKAARTGS